jgi:hypothetical protein
VPWPLDPALARTRDETTLVRTLFSTPLRVDPRSGDIAPGLCTTWQALQGGRVWRFRCAHADAIAKQLLRVAHLRTSAGHWMFARATKISSAGDVVYIRLGTPWLRFPYALTSATAAPRGIPGPFHVVRERPGSLEVRRGALTIRFVELPAHRAAVLFRQGLLDEAPVPLGDIRAALADKTVAPAVRIQPLLAVDALVFDLRRGSVAQLPNTRRAYWQTADRADYQALVPEGKAGSAVSLVAGVGLDRNPASAFRAAKRLIPTLPPIRVNIVAEDDAVLSYGSSLLIASWRDLGLGAYAASGSRADGRFVRLSAPYPQDEALLAQVAPRAEMFAALSQNAALARADDAVYASAAVVPVAWVVDSRFVSPRVRGWREDPLGDVDYARVTLNPGR